MTEKISVRNEVEVPIAEHTAKFVSFHGLNDEKEHVALDFRKTNNDGIINVRIHSECLTGDIFGSKRCDCGEQLNEAVNKFANEGGVILYLRQEGRGIGLYNKLDAYSLQLEGHDTYAANRLLGLHDDLRDYQVAAEMLKAMGIKKVNLLSNNPEKINQLKNYGIEVVDQTTTGVFLKDENKSYLEAKVKHTSHLINLVGNF